MPSYITYKFRIKDSAVSKHLEKMAHAVNFVWNYANETTDKAWRRDRRWLGWAAMCKLTAGSSAELGIHSDTVQGVVQDHEVRRRVARRARLRWRSKKRSLGWIPFKARSIKVDGDRVRYLGKWFRFWKSREVPSNIKEGAFVQDARRRWYVCFECEVPVENDPRRESAAIGIDLGLKQQVTCSDGSVYARDSFTRKYEERLAKAQRARQRRRVTAIHAKIANARKDWAHKVSTSIVRSASSVVVGAVSSRAMIRKGRGFAKSASDAGWSQFRAMLAYKARRLGVAFREIDEAWSTVTCSVCFARSGPSGLSALGVREWECSICGTPHLRDVNAAKNILLLGQGVDLRTGIGAAMRP